MPLHERVRMKRANYRKERAWVVRVPIFSDPAGVQKMIVVGRSLVAW